MAGTGTYPFYKIVFFSAAMTAGFFAASLVINSLAGLFPASPCPVSRSEQVLAGDLVRTARFASIDQARKEGRTDYSFIVEMPLDKAKEELDEK